jgi:hypothetical protein
LSFQGKIGINTYWRAVTDSTCGGIFSFRMAQIRMAATGNSEFPNPKGIHAEAICSLLHP